MTETNKRVRVSAVLPCLNEERTLGICITKALAAFEALGVSGEVVVADNGSTDGSVQLAESSGARVIHENRKGYGAALQAGIAAARGEIVIMGDADDSYDWSSIGPFISKIDEGYDLVMGNRFKGGIERGAMPPLHRYFGNPVLSRISRFAFRVPIGDFHCGMRAIRREAYMAMRPNTPGMEFATEMIAAAAGYGLKIAEIPIRLHCDKRDRPPHLRSFQDGWRHLRFIVSYAPDLLLLVPGIAFLLTGFSIQALLALGPFSHGNVYLGIHFLALGGMLSLMGFNVMAMGFLAKLIVAAKYPKTLGVWAKRFLRLFRLERGLALGGTLIAGGVVWALAIFSEWVRRFGAPMPETVHQSFVAMHLIVLGANVTLFSFVLHLYRQEHA